LFSSSARITKGAESATHGAATVGTAEREGAPHAIEGYYAMGNSAGTEITLGEMDTSGRPGRRRGLAAVKLRGVSRAG